MSRYSCHLFLCITIGYEWWDYCLCLYSNIKFCEHLGYSWYHCQFLYSTLSVLIQYRCSMNLFITAAWILLYGITDHIYHPVHAGTRATSTSVGPLPDSWLAARMAELTPDLHIFLSWGLIAKSFHSLQSFSVSCFHVILGLPGSRFPSTCMWKAVLTAPLEHSTCPYHRSLLSFRMRSRSSMPHWTWWWQCLAAWHCRSVIIALLFRCRRWRFGFVNGQVSLAWSIALHTQELYTRPRVLKERWYEERTGSRSLNFFQVVFTRVVSKVHSHLLLRACLLGSKRKLPPKACGPSWTSFCGLPSKGRAVPQHLVHL